VCAGRGELLLPDNRVTKCDVCDRKVQYRPHAPKSVKRCIQCAALMMEDGDEAIISPRMLEDFKADLKRRQH
jgi:hypothetical protein